MEKESEIYREIVNGIGQPLFLLEDDFVILYANPAAYEYILPTSKLEGKKIEELLRSDTVRQILDMSRKEKSSVLNAEVSISLKNAEKKVLVDVYPVEMNGSLNFILLLKDVTHLGTLKEKEEKERRFDAVCKAIAKLAKMLEPEVLGILSLINLMERQTAKSEELEFLKKEALRLKFIISEALECTLAPHFEPQKTNIHKVIEDAVKSLNKEITEKEISLERDYTPDIPHIEADPFELYKAVRHIIKNAIEASEPGQTVTVRTYWSQEKIQPNSNTLCIEVVDEGKGVPEDIEPELFTPFVTTKNGHLGLGLATAFMVAKKHKGDIKYTRKNGKTHFRILIPV